MTKFGKISIFILIIGLGVFAYFGFFHKKEKDVVEITPVEKEEGFVYEEESEYFSIRMTYPKDSIVSADAEVLVMSRVAGFKELFLDLDEDDIAILNDSAAGKYILEADYLKKESDIGMTAYVLNTYEFTGGAHGNPGMVTLNYDASGKRIYIKDLLKRDSQNLAGLSLMVQEKLLDLVEGDASMLFLDGVRPVYENFSNFYFDNDNLVFLFPPYQVGPYSMGTVEIKMPIEEVFGYINKDYLPDIYKNFEKEFRGSLIYGAEIRSFSECDSEKSYWYQDTTGNLEDEYTHAKKSEDAYEKVPVILEGYTREIIESDGEFAKEYDGIFVVTDLSQIGGGGVCQ